LQFKFGRRQRDADQHIALADRRRRRRRDLPGIGRVQEIVRAEGEAAGRAGDRVPLRRRRDQDAAGDDVAGRAGRERSVQAQPASFDVAFALAWARFTVSAALA
jgi:hypothetical protein